jgi:hypothetical protein
MRTNLVYPFIAALISLFMLKTERASAITYYSKANGNWNAASTWSTVTYGDPTNTGTYPVTGDIVNIGDGYTILLVSSSACSGLNIGQGTSGILEYPNFGTITLSVSGSITINNGGKLWYNYNNSRTHNLFVSVDLTNNGTLDLYSDNNDVVNLIFNGAANCNISGTGTFAFNLVTVSKASRSYYLNVQSDAFLTAAPPSTTNPRIDLVKGTFVCNTATTTSWSDAVATCYTIPMDVILEVRSGTVNMLTAGDTLINSGKIYLTGGRLEIGSTAGKKGILYKDAGSIDPEIEITAGTLLVYGGINSFTGSNPLVFKMTGGNLDLNSGTTGTDGYPLLVQNTSGSQFVISSGNIYIRKPSSTPATPEFDFGSSNVYHNVTDGHVYFGDGFTPYTFDYMPYVSYTYPSFEAAGAIGTILKPYTFINSKMLSLKIGIGNTFDIASGGNNATSTQISITSTVDGMYAFYNEGTFLERTGHVILTGTVLQYYYSPAGEYTFYNLTVNNPAGIYLDKPMTISGTLTLTNGVVSCTATELLTINHNALVTGTSNSSFIDGPVCKIGNAAFTFPVGDNGVYRPISISAPTLDSDAYTATYFYTSPDPTYPITSLAPSLSHISDTEYWTLDRGMGSSTVNVTLSWNGTSGGIDDLPTLRVAQWDGSMWQDQGNGGTTGNTAAGTIVNALPTASFGPFTLASSSGSNNSLPVELINFHVISKDGVNEINWMTASEKDNDFFQIEKTTDGVSYQIIAEVDGAGNSTSVIRYQFNDLNSENKSCYRLKQFDFNGDFNYSETKCAGINHQAGFTIKPSIIRDEDLTIELSNDSRSNTKLFITDVTGKIVFSKNLNEAINIIYNNEINFGAKGIYHVTLVSDNSTVHSNRVVVL